MPALFEQHRPREWSQVVGQDRAIAKIDSVRSACGTVGGHCWFISGSSGTGKTTIARLLAAEVADPFCIDEMGPADLSADYLRAVASKYAGKPLGGRGWAVIVNEVHALRKGQIEDLLTRTEPEGGLPSWFIWVFTTTSDGADKLFEDYADAGPFASRCEELQLSRRDLTKPFALRLVAGARSSGLLNGHPDSFYVSRAERLLKDKRNNMRAAWQAVAAGYLSEGGGE